MQPEVAGLSEAMERFAEGDGQAFVELYRGLAPRLFPLCQRLCGRADDPEDLLQETFSKLHRARATFVTGSNVLHWAFAIARSTHLDHLRKRRRRPVLETFVAIETFPLTAGDYVSPADSVEAGQIAELVERILFEMPEPQRAAFLLTQEEGLTSAEAGAVLGATETAIRLRVMRAREAIERALRKGRS